VREECALASLLAASATIFEGAACEGVHQLAGNKAMLTYRLGERPACLSPQLTAMAARAYEQLSAAGRAILRALSEEGCDAQDTPLTAVMEPDPLPRGAVGSSLLTLFEYYGVGAGAAPHTDCGLLTLVHASAGGLEVHSAARGWQPLHCRRGQIAVLVGETLQYASAGALPPCLHRVLAPAAGATRRSLVLRLRGDPGALLPQGAGMFGWCSTVDEFERLFRLTHASVNAPAGGGASEAAAVGSGALVAPAAAFAEPAHQWCSAADAVLNTPLLTHLVVHHLCSDSTGKSLACAEATCVALRRAIRPVWRDICLFLVPSSPEPADGTDAVTHWRRLFRRYVSTITICFNLLSGDQMCFKIKGCTRLGDVFEAFAYRRRHPREFYRFIVEGQFIEDDETAGSLGLHDGADLFVVMKLRGD
jgi:hypothetical protein